MKNDISAIELTYSTWLEHPFVFCCTSKVFALLQLRGILHTKKGAFHRGPPLHYIGLRRLLDAIRKRLLVAKSDSRLVHNALQEERI